MRTLGHGSVSSFLKVILDVFYFTLLAAAAVVALGIVAVLLLSFRPDLLGSHLKIYELRIEGPWLGPLAAAVLRGRQAATVCHGAHTCSELSTSPTGKNHTQRRVVAVTSP